MESKIEVLSTVKITYSPDLYKIVDCLNRTLKDQDLNASGLALDKEDQNKAVFTHSFQSVMIELAGGGGYRTAAASATGPAQNPWDRTRWAGGSSSGPGRGHCGWPGHVRTGLRNIGFHHHARCLLRGDRTAGLPMVW